jgi:hypothetical protein
MGGMGGGGFGGMGGHGFGQMPFEERYHAVPIAAAEKSDTSKLEAGGKICLPPSALQKLAQLEISYPMLFELTNTVGIPLRLLRFRSFDRTRPGLILGPKGRTTFKWSGRLCASIRVVYAQGP